MRQCRSQIHRHTALALPVGDRIAHAAATVNVVVTDTAFQQVISTVAVQGVIAIHAQKRIVTRIADKQVGGGISCHCIVCGAAENIFNIDYRITVASVYCNGTVLAFMKCYVNRCIKLCIIERIDTCTTINRIAAVMQRCRDKTVVSLSAEECI